MKNWKVWVFFGSIWLLSHTSFSQDFALKKAKYEVLKRCLEYLAVDSPKNPNKIVNDCPDCTTLAQCSEYSKNINNGGNFLDFANPENPPHSIITDLSSYKEQLIKKLKSNKPDRVEEERFKALMSTLDVIVVAAPTAAGNTGGPGKKANEEEDKKAKEVADKKAKEEADKKAKEVADIKEEEEKRKGSPLMNYMLYLLSLLNMALAGYFFFKSGKDRRQNYDRWKELGSRINFLEQNISVPQGNNNLKPLETRIEMLEKTVDSLWKQIETGNNSDDRLKAESDVSTSRQSGKGYYLPPSPTPAVREPEKCKYALYADTGDGFSVSSLSNQISQDSLFEIRITSPNSAKLSVTQNESAQKMAFSDPYQYLRTTCTYTGEPGGRIRTNTPGDLELVGNKWRIITKAEISFYR